MDAFAPLPDLSSMLAVNEFFDTNLPLFAASAASARASTAGETQGQALPSLTEHMQTLQAYVDRKDNKALSDDELTAYAQLAVWHDRHADALGGFYGSFTDARRVLSELEGQAVQEYIDSTAIRESGYTHIEESTAPRVVVPFQLVNSAETCLQGPQTHISGQVIYMGNGIVRRQSSYDIYNTEPADSVASAPSEMCVNYFATANDDLKRLYDSQEKYMSVFDQYSATMFPVTTLRESVRTITQPGYIAGRFGDAYDGMPKVKTRKSEVKNQWTQKGYIVQGHEDVLLPSADFEIDAGVMLVEPEYRQ